MEPAYQYDLDETDVQLADLLQDVESGHDVVLNRHGEPVAKVIPLRPTPRRPGPGLWKGKVRIADDFDELDDETLAAFNGERP
ncbi:prevent-host-death family protein [Spinactinospora alkalitolerans]|uniref:Prevent-host-death family protein n=1 Tax=Spinactinospora alkalitolerans TaxID=687207 RepID=A0A852U052_9ACTN|nr:type II toxin-antitoxin system prevent-host-death family antitoxin [Spinactinospora alkalitolerans]NYE48702.1 prevent-host-death family protein [Spinactinospora alkalitolerans]